MEAGSCAANDVFVAQSGLAAFPALGQNHLRLFLRRTGVFKCIHLSSILVSMQGGVVSILSYEDECFAVFPTEQVSAVQRPVKRRRFLAKTT